MVLNVSEEMGLTAIGSQQLGIYVVINEKNKMPTGRKWK
jgi:hypothetical protein